MRTIIAALLLSFPTMAAAEAPDLPRSAPEAQGISSSSILTFVEKTEAEIDSLHSLMVLRHGNVVAEGDVLLFDAEMNVGFGPTDRPLLIGRQEP